MTYIVSLRKSRRESDFLELTVDYYDDLKLLYFSNLSVILDAIAFSIHVVSVNDKNGDKVVNLLTQKLYGIINYIRFYI